MQRLEGNRKKCYIYYRPKSSCMCEHIHPINTRTKEQLEGFSTPFHKMIEYQLGWQF